MLLTASDVPAAHALSMAEGWNQTPADWARLIRLEPAGCFAARDGDMLTGTVTTTTYGGTLAWIGMMIVRPEFRGRGIGAALMRQAIEYVHGLGISCIKLDATPMGRPLYQSLGFVVESELERWKGTAPTTSGREEPGLTRAGSLEPVFALDRAAYGADRSRLLAVLAADMPDGPLTSARDGAAPDGFALLRAGRAASYVGPIIATSTGTAVQLLDGMLARCAGSEVCLDRNLKGFFDADTLAACGLVMSRGLTRMRLGPPVTGTSPESICAIAGPAVG
jgi:GNAT superfamily N-acetyltransferase